MAFSRLKNSVKGSTTALNKVFGAELFFGSGKKIEIKAKATKIATAIH